MALDTILLAGLLAIPLVSAIATLRLVVRRRSMRDRATFRLMFPRGLNADATTTFVRSLAGLLPPHWKRLFVWPHVIFEIQADREGISHSLIAGRREADFVLGQLRGKVPGIRVEALETRPAASTLAGSFTQTARLRQLRVDDPASVSTAILAALQPLGPGESIIMQYVIAPTVAKPLKENFESSRIHRFDSWSWHSLFEPLPSKDEVKAAREKLTEPVFSAALRIGARASRSRARLLLGRVTASLHIANTAYARLKRRLLEPAATKRRLVDAVPPTIGYPLLLNAAELAGLLAFPIDSPTIAGLRLGGCRQLPPSPLIPASGRVLAEANFPGAERPLAISMTDSLTHMQVAGPTGVGKSTFMLNDAAGLAATHGVVIMDPKGDFAEDLLDRIPAERERDVIVFDPTDTERPVGLSLFTGGRHELELIARNFVGIIQRIWASSWGPRTADILSAAVLTLCMVPGMTPCEIPLILTNQAFRRRMIGGLNDPLGLTSFWSWYESLGTAEQSSVIGPVMNKLRAFLLWPTIRNCIGQSRTTFTLDEILRDGKILVVRLPRGVLGSESAALLGSLIFSCLWGAVQRRASMPPVDRKPVIAFLDEAQNFLALPTPIDEVLAESRGLGLGLVLAHQSLSQFAAPLRQAVFANCRSRVVFQTSAADAASFAKEFAPDIGPEDLMGLPAREVVMRLNVGYQVSPPVTARTFAPVAALGSAVRVKELSRQRYGVDRDAVEAEIRRRHDGGEGEGFVGRRGRS